MDWLPWLFGFWMCALTVMMNVRMAVVRLGAGDPMAWGFYVATLAFACGGWYCFYGFVLAFLRRW